MRVYKILFVYIVCRPITPYRSSGQNNSDLIENLKRNGVIKSEAVRKAMLAVDRGNYCKENPYVDSPMPIGYGATISAPHMHAHALEALFDHLTRAKRALDVGSGSGYLTACMAAMMGADGLVVGIDHIPELVELSIENLQRGNPDLYNSGRVKMVVADGRLGYETKSPYGAIHVGAAAYTVPKALIEQLALGGRMVLGFTGWTKMGTPDF